MLPFHPGRLSGRNALNVTSGPSAEVSQFFGRISTPDGTHTTAYTTLIDGLVSDGVWAKLDALWICAAADEATALTNLVSSSFGSTNNGAAFSADHGFTGDGSSDYVDTGFNPVSAAGHYVQDSASFGYYDRTSAVSGVPIAMGANDGSNVAHIQLQSGGLATCVVNAGGGDVFFPSGTAQGMMIATRTDATTSKIYANGSLATSGTGSASSTGSVNANFFLAARNQGGTPVAFADHEFAAAFLGGALTATDAGNLSARINAYMTALGVNVY